MKGSSGIELFKLSIEKVWKMIFKNMWEPWCDDSSCVFGWLDQTWFFSVTDQHVFEMTEKS